MNTCIVRPDLLSLDNVKGLSGQYRLKGTLQVDLDHAYAMGRDEKTEYWYYVSDQSVERVKPSLKPAVKLPVDIYPHSVRETRLMLYQLQRS